MKISLIHPSRSRPEQAKKTHDLWMENASGQIEIEYILSLDLSDPLLRKYDPSVWFDSTIIAIDNDCVVQAANVGAKVATGNILILVSDDFECPKFWDVSIMSAMKGNNDCVLKTFDGIQPWIVTLPIMDRAYYEKQGYFYYPEYRHMFCDTDMTHKADLERRLIMRNDLIFKHAHYSTGATQKDAVNEKADSTWAQGEEVYLKRVKNKFGLETTLNVLNLHPNANPHIDWLTHKLQ